MKVEVTSSYRDAAGLHRPGEVLEVTAEKAVWMFTAKVARPLATEPEKAVMPSGETRLEALKFPELRVRGRALGLTFPPGTTKDAAIAAIREAEE